MFVVAGLYHRRGIGGFDPVSDGFLVYHDDPQDAYYYTWRSGNSAEIPEGCSLAGVFLADHHGGIVFEGTRNFGGLGYIDATVLPKLKLGTGYEHSEFHGLLKAPQDVNELVYKCAMINQLYYGAPTYEEARPELHLARGTGWEVSPEKGIVKLSVPGDLWGGQLANLFYEIVKAVPVQKRHQDPRIPTT